MASRFLFSNNGTASLTVSLTNVATSVPLAAGNGGRFPVPAAGQFVRAMIRDSLGNYEFVNITANASDTLTIVRAQEGTVAQAFNLANTPTISIRPSKELMEAFTQWAADEVVTGTWSFAGITATQMTMGSRVATRLGLEIGQCQLQYVDSTHLKLVPYNGDQLFINGQFYAIPAVGVSLTASPTAGTLYYIYAYINAGNIALEMISSATTTPTWSTTNPGVRIKNPVTPDDTRTLVGMAYGGAGNVFVNTATQRFVRSWFNSGKVQAYNQLNVSGSVPHAWGQVSSTSTKIEFLSWANEDVELTGGYTGYDTVASQTFYGGIGVDSTVGVSGLISAMTVAAAGTFGTVTPFYSTSALSEGYHYATLLAQTAVAGGAAVTPAGSYAAIRGTLGR